MEYIPENTGITVLGGGNIGTQFACVCASKGYRVNVFSSRPEKYDGILEIVDEFGKVTVGKLYSVTNDIAEAMNGCRIVIVTYPAFLFRETASRILPYIKSGMDVCVIPGTGGAEFAFRECIEAGATLHGLQRVPAVARLEVYGKRVRQEGLRDKLFLASIPDIKKKSMSEFMGNIWGIPCIPLPNYLNVTLTPSNPILHTTRLRTMFADYKDGKVYARNPFFYGEWSDESSELLFACDDELQGILKRMDKLDLSGVRSLKDHYGCSTVEAMTEKIRSIRSLRNILSPMKKIVGGWIPDFQSRYFRADFPYGLAILEGLAEVLGCDTPNIRDTMYWYRKVTGNTTHMEIGGRHSFHSLDDIYKWYLPGMADSAWKNIDRHIF